MTEIEEWVIVGIITSAHGISGKLKVQSLSDFEERFTKPGIRWLQKENDCPIAYELISGLQKPGKKFFIITLKEIENRSQAEKLLRHKILVRKEDIPKLKSGEFHIFDLLGLKVKLIKEKKLIIIGEVCDLMTENNNLLVIRLYESNKKILVPFVKEIVPEINKQKNFLVIDPPKGLIEL